MPSKLHDYAHPAAKRTPDTVEDFSEFEGENEPQNMAEANEEGKVLNKMILLFGVNFILFSIYFDGITVKISQFQ